jgi:hypothetical protein
MAEDANYTWPSGTYGETTDFRVKGALTITAPATTTIWRINQTQTISWDVDHGQINKVKIIASPSGNFTGDEYVVATNLDPFTANGGTGSFSAFNAVATPVGGGSYDWTIPVTANLTDTTKFKVRDDNETDFADVISTASVAMYIRGTITVLTPTVDYAPYDVDWNVGDTDKQVKFRTYGDTMGTVWIYLYDGATEYDLAGPSGISTIGDGNIETFSGFTVPDVKSHNCTIRVRDAQISPANTEGESGTSFSTYPTITNVTVVPSAGDEGSNPPIWRAGLSNQTVTWTENDIADDTLISTVQIYYSPTGVGGLAPGILLKDDVVTHESCTTITAPTALSWQNAVIRVRDKASGFEDKVYGDSAEFRVLGRVVYGASPASGDNWFIGETNKLITWTAYGDEMTSVDIYIDYDDGLGYQYVKTEATVPGSADSWVFDDPDVTVDGVGDHVTENATIKIEDVDANRKTYTQYISPAFNIAGKFENIAITAVDPENTEIIADLAATITWTKTGTVISDIVLEYSTTGGSSWNLVDDLSTVPNTESYSWTPPADAISDTCLLRITDPDNSAATGQIASTFIIASKVKVLQPDINDSWDTNTTQTIQWQKWGEFTNVNIYYSSDDGQNWTAIDATGTVPSHNGDGLNGSYDWYIDENTVLSPNARIKVIDSIHETYGLAIVSDAFETKGSLEVLWPDDGTEGYDVYVAGISRDIKWKRYGNIEGVKVYLDDGTSGYQLITELGVSGTVDFVGAETEHTEAWTPPEVVDKTYKIKVEDKNNPNIFAESPLFQIKGEVQITMPDAQQPTWAIPTTQTITWNVIHGSIANVKIIGSRSGNFTGGADEFVISNQTQADNELAFSASNYGTYGYVAQGSYNWTLTELTPSIIGNTARIRIIDADTDYDVKTTSSTSFTITGTITVDAPASGELWRVRDGAGGADDGPAKTVSWTCDGEITSVDISFYNGTSWATIATGVSSAAGSGNTWTTDNWIGGNGVADAKSIQCLIKVKDTQFGVEDDSDPFKVYPTIKVTQPSIGQLLRAETSGNTVAWDTPGSTQVSTVDIYLDFQGGAGGYPSNPVIDWVAGSPCNTVVLPTNLSEVAVFKVVDDANSEVYGISKQFKIHGSITDITIPDEVPETATTTEWIVGNTPTITWQYEGDISTVNISVSYNGGTDYTQIGSAAASAGSWTWSTGVTDNATDQAVIKIEDADVNRKDDTYIESAPFSIVGSFTILTPGTGETVTYDVPFDITWTPNGSSVTSVNIYYDVDAGGWNLITQTPVANTGSPASYAWTMTDMVSSANARIKIESSDSTKPSRAAISGQTGQPGLFAIHGDITFGNSPQAGAEWVVGTAGNNIAWVLAGKIDFVDVVYSKDNGSDGFAFTIASNLDTTIYPTGYSWDIPTNEDILSKNLGLIRVKDSNYATVYDESPNFSIKGVLSNFDITFPADSGTFPNVLRVGEAAVITWLRTGSTMGDVNIRYSTDRGLSWPSGNIIWTMSSADGATGYAWSVDDNITRDNGVNTGVIVRVESVDDDRVYTESAMLSIMGRIQINDPYQQARTYVVGSTSETISWTPTGTYSTVKIDYNTAYDFTGEGGNITNSATNSASGIMGSYGWPQVPDFIRSTLYIRVADVANSDLVYSITDQAYPCAIQGSITGVSKPVSGEIWYVGDTDKLVEWTANGSIAKVEIAFATEATDPETAPYTVISQAGGVDSGDGTHDWLTSNWLNGYNGGVADAKSDKCYIRVRDLNDPTVPAQYSAQFTIKPKVTLSNMPTEWVAGTQSGTVDFHGTTEVHEITWNIPGSTVSNVRIDLSYDGGNTWPVALATGVPVNSSMPYEITDTLPDTLSPNARIKVSDDDPLYSDLVNGTSSTFKIIGGLILIQPAAGVDWEIGLTKQVTWTPYGNMGGNVDVYYKYDGGDWSLSPVASAPASSGSCDWVIPDTVSENVQVKITDAIRPDDTWDESAVFNIMARFDITYPENGDVIIAEDQIDITWDNYNITSSTHAKLEYYTPEYGDWRLITDGIDDGDGQDLLVLNSGSCPWTPPATDLTNGCIIKISDPDNANSENQGAGLVKISAEITVTSPVESGSDIKWQVGTTETISWTFKGDFPNVLMYYSSTGNTGPWTLIDEVPTIYPYSTEGGDGIPDNKAGSYDWTIPVDTDLSNNNAHIKVAKSDEPLIVFGINEDPITMKGNLTIERPKPSTVPADGVQRVYGGDTPQYCFIDWTVVGEIDDVVVQYTTNDVSWTTITQVATATATEYYWDIPGSDVNIIGTGRNIKVYDLLNENDTYAISEDFEIKGEITLDYPTAGGGETFIVGVEENLQWTPYGNFPGNQVLLLGSTDNFVTDFKIAIRPAGPHGTPQTYTWNVFDTIEGSVPISTNVKIRVEDYNDSDVKDTSGTMTIKGALQINTPTQVWYVNDTNRSITWDYDGPITTVDLQIRNATDTGWIDLTPTDGIDCSTKYYDAFTVPDAISNTSKLRIKDHDDPTGTVENISGNFIVRGKLAFKTDMPALGQVFVVGAEQPGYNNDIHWNMDGTFTTVEIRYSTNDGADFPDTNIIAQGWNAYTVYKWDPVADDMSQLVRFKVIDERDPDNVFAISERCTIAGSITILNLTNYNDPVLVGDSFTIDWDKTGLLLQNVDIMYSIDGGSDGYPYPIQTNVTASLGQWPWVPGASDPLSPDARIKISDHDNPAAAYDESPIFKLQSKWIWDETNGTGDPGGKVWVVGDDEVFEWSTNGLVSNVRIDYDVDGDDSWEDPPIETSVTNTGTYTWNVPDQSNIISDTVKIKISDVNDSDSKLISGVFKIRGYLGITSPVLGDEWDVDSNKTIYWEKRGPVADVNVYYQYNGGGYTDNKINVSPIPAADGQTIGCPWTIPDNISDNVQVKVVSTLDSTTYDESDQFTIRGVLAIDQHPVATDEWVPGDVETISWTKNGTIPTVRIEYSPTGLEIDYATIPGAETLSGNTFDWTIPDNIGTTNKIRIFNVDEATKPTKRAVSDAFRIKGRLTITAPTIDEVVPVNFVTDEDSLKYPIQWTVEGTIAKVELQYSYDGGAFSTLSGTGAIDGYYDAETTPGSGVGQYLWLVPNTISDNVVLKIINRDAGESDVIDDTDVFRIAGRLDLTAPDGGTIYEVDDLISITWITRGSLNNVKLQYSTNSGQSYDFDITPTGGVPASDQSFGWTIPDSISEYVKVQIVDEDSAAYTVGDQSQSDFEIRGKIDILRPTSSDIWLVDSEEAIQWRIHGSIATVKIEFSVDGVIDPDPVIASIAGDTTDYSGTGEPDGLGQCLWTLPDDAVGKNNVRIKITNLGDTDVYTESEVFTARGGFQFIDRGGVDDDSPLAGARWAVNSSQTIKWTTFGIINTVRVFYTLDGTDPQNATWIELTDPATGIVNTGTYQWSSVTNTINPADNSLVKIKVVDFNDVDAIGYTEFFTIHDIIYLDRPNGTDDPQDAKVLKVGTTEDIKWHSEAKDTGGTGTQYVTIEYSTNGGTDWVSPPIADSTDNDGLHSWQIPDDISDEVRVRIYDINDSQVSDMSLNNCSIKPKFTISVPNASTTWLSLNEETITWTTSGTVSEVEIYYSTDNGQNWSQVLDEVEPIESWPYQNDGAFEWKIPNVARTPQALIKVVSSTDPNAYEESQQFNIKGQLIVDYPTDTGELFRCSTSELLQWTTKGIIPTVGLKYWYNSAWYDILNASSGIDHVNNGSFNWTVPDIKSNDAKIMVYDIGDSTVKGESLNTFEIKPRLVFESSDEPIGSEIYLYGTAQTISWTTYGPVPTVEIEYSKDGMASWETPKLTTSEPNNDSFAWTIPDSVSDDCYIRVSDSSEPTNTYAISGKFRIRSVIDLLSPNGGVPVGVDEQVDIQWTQDGETADIYIYYFDDLVGVKLPIDGATGIIPTPAPQGGIRTYTWTVPDFINNNVKVGVADPNDVEGSKDESIAVFPILATFTVIKPDIDSKWDIGTQHTIEWSWTGTVDSMNLYYSLDGVAYTPIQLVTGYATDPDKMATFDWTPDPNASPPVTPSPNFYIKVADATDPDNAYGISDKAKVRADFTLDPPPQTEFIVGDTYTITWDCVGAVTNVDLHYSIDSGATFPAGKEIALAIANDGATGFDWTIPDDISQTMRVRVKSEIDDDAYDITLSDLRIKGEVWIKAPILDDEWDIGQDYDIKWGWKGTMPEVKITYSVNGASGPFNPIQENYGTANDGIVANGAGAGGATSEYTFTWTIPDEATDQAIIKIQDARSTESDVMDDSEMFHITGYIIVKSPVSTDRLDVASTHNISWEWGGTMPEVKITYSVNGVSGPFNPIQENYDTANDGIVANGTGSGGPGSEYSFAWTVPDDISTTCIVRVADPRDETTVYDDSDGTFKIQGAFTLITPAVELNDNGTPSDPSDDFYESRWVTNEIRDVTWSTFGTIPKVDLIYSKDNFFSEIPLKDEFDIDATDVDNTGTFSWKLPDDRSDTVKIRIYDHNDHEVYVEGPVAAGGVDTMKIDYYTITWDIRDLVTNLPINGLTVSDTSGWESTGLSSPISHDVPAGIWTADWTHKDYGPISETYLVGWDEDAQQWRGDRVIFRTMETLVVHIWRSYSEFAYDVDSDKLEITTWLERDGSLVPGAVIVDVKIYDGLDLIKRKTILVEEKDPETGAGDDKHHFYDDIPDSVELWIGSRYNDNGTPDFPDDDFEEERNMDDCLTDSAPYQVSEMPTPSNFGGFFIQSWTPTSYTAGGTNYDTLQAGKVYAVTSHIYVRSGGNFITPVSFSVDIPRKMRDMEEAVDEMTSTVNNVLDKPLSEVNQELQDTLDAQTIIIQDKLDEQTGIIQTGIDDMETTIEAASANMQAAVNETLTSFEQRTYQAITDLEKGAQDSLAASQVMVETAQTTKEMMEEAAEISEQTARKYSGELILPRTVLVGDTMEVRYRGLSGLSPYMDIINHENKLIIQSKLLQEDNSQKGLYTTEVKIDGDLYLSGKAITVIVIADVGYGVESMEVGSVAIESTTLSQIEGLVSLVPQAKSAAEEARDLIEHAGKALENAFKSGTHLDLALTYLQETVESLPKIMAQEGPLPELVDSMNDVSDRLIKLAGEEGYDMSTLLEHALSDSPTLRDMRIKTDQVNSVIELLKKLFEAKFGGEDAPVVSTTLEPGSVIFKVVAANPSPTKTQTVPVKLYLPQEVEAENILDQGGLELEYDSVKSSYFLYSNAVVLAPKQTVVFNVEVEDVWMVPEDEINTLKTQAERIVQKLENTDYYAKAKETKDTIYQRLDEVVRSQNDDTVTRNQHIGIYRSNIKVIDEIKEDIARMEKLLTFAGGPPVPEMLEESDLKLDAPSTTTTWMIIFIIITFIGVLGAVFFFTWHRQRRTTESFFTQARESAFPQVTETEEEAREEEDKEKEAS